jgi:CheY-like chemotaxis protein
MVQHNGGHLGMTAAPPTLVVDPDEARGLRLLATCQQAGLEPELVSDGEQALAAIERLERASLLVTQLALPRVDGFEVIARFRGRFPAAGGARVVALSAFPELRAAARAKQPELGLDLVLMGDPPPEMLGRAIQQILGGVEPSDRFYDNPELAAQQVQRAEAQRRELIQRCGLDRLPLRPPDEELQGFVRNVAGHCGSPIALMTVALDDTLVFPARCGIDATDIERYSSLCNKVIEAGEPLFVPDAHENPAFHGNGLVKAGVIRGYASTPLYVGEGPPVGTLCLINSHEPLRLELAQVRSLRRAAVELGELLNAKT